jgi:hypothetical protein
MEPRPLLGRGHPGIPWPLLVALAGLAAALPACAMKASTLPKVTVGNTGCAPEALAVFNYDPDARSWMAICGTELFSCSDAGRRTARCSPMADAAKSPELVRRAALLLHLPRDRREPFTTLDIMVEDEATYTRRIATLAALSEEDMGWVDDIHRLYVDLPESVRADFNRCGLDGLVAVSIDRKTGRWKGEWGHLYNFVKSEEELDCVKATAERLEVPVIHRKRFRHVLLHLDEPSQEIIEAAADLSATPPGQEAGGPTGPEAKSEPSREPQTKEGTAALTPDTEARIRAHLDDHRDDILACVDAERAVVRVERTSDGGQSVGLQGAGAGTPVEGCVGAVVGSLPLEAGEDEGGVVLHLVR